MTPTTPNRFSIICIGGALNKRTFTLDAEQKTFVKLGFKYEGTGRRDGDHWVFVPIPSSRKMRRTIQAHLAGGGLDPRLMPKKEPARNMKRRQAKISG